MCHLQMLCAHLGWCWLCSSPGAPNDRGYRAPFPRTRLLGLPLSCRLLACSRRGLGAAILAETLILRLRLFINASISAFSVIVELLQADEVGHLPVHVGLFGAVFFAQTAAIYKIS